MFSAVNAMKQQSTLQVARVWCKTQATDMELMQWTQTLGNSHGEYDEIVLPMEKLDELFATYTPTEIMTARDTPYHFDTEDKYFRWIQGSVASSNDIKELMSIMHDADMWLDYLSMSLFWDLPERLQAVIKAWDTPCGEIEIDGM